MKKNGVIIIVQCICRKEHWAGFTVKMCLYAPSHMLKCVLSHTRMCLHREKSNPRDIDTYIYLFLVHF